MVESSIGKLGVCKVDVYRTWILPLNYIFQIFSHKYILRIIYSHVGMACAFLGYYIYSENPLLGSLPTFQLLSGCVQLGATVLDNLNQREFQTKRNCLGSRVLRTKATRGSYIIIKSKQRQRSGRVNKVMDQVDLAVTQVKGSPPPWSLPLPHFILKVEQQKKWLKVNFLPSKVNQDMAPQFYVFKR